MTTPPPEQQTALDEMLSGLMADGVLQSKGSFTLNHERAREQMGAARFTDPERYVLGLVQVAVMRGAEKIAFEVDTDDMVMTFDGPRFSDAELQRVFSELKLDPADPESAMRWELAMAVAAAESLSPKFIAIVSGDGERGAAVLIQPDQPYQFHSLESPFAGTRIHVKSRLEAGQLVDSLKNLDDSLPLEVLLRQRCQYATTTIELEGQRLSGGRSLERVVGETPVSAEHTQGVAGYVIDCMDAAEVRLLRHGVWLDSVRGELPGAGFVAVVESPHLRMDLSQDTAVRDDTLDAMVAAAEAVQPTALLALCRVAAAPDADMEPHRAWLRTVVKSALRPRRTLPRGGDAAPLEEALAAVPLFRVLPGDAQEKSRWSIDQVDAWLAEKNPLKYLPALSADPFGGDARRIAQVVAWCHEHAGRALQLADRDDEPMVRALFGRRIKALYAKAPSLGPTGPTGPTEATEPTEVQPAKWGTAAPASIPESEVLKVRRWSDFTLTVVGFVLVVGGLLVFLWIKFS